MRKTFTWILSLMILLTAFATQGYAQGEVQETVELYAEDASFCYNEDNDYTVTVSVRDFIQLDSVELSLEYNAAVYTFAGASDVIPALSAGTVTETTSGIIDIEWDGAATTIGNDVKTDIMVLHFTLNGYPGNLSEPPVVDMEWGTTDFWYDAAGTQDLVNTVISEDGSLTVSVDLTDIETTITPEDCAGGEATVTVTAPAADYYLFNEDANPADWSWTTSPDYLAAAGETVTIRIMTDDGCMSLREVVVIPETIDPVSFSVDTQDPACYGGQGSVVINAAGGTAPYTYYIGLDSANIGTAETKSNFQFSMAPGDYYVWVQDANGCADTLLPWEAISIQDTNSVINVTGTPTDVLCYGGMNGEIDVEVTPSAAYDISIDGGVTWITTVDGDTIITDLAAGTYVVWAKNENGCTVPSGNVVVGQPTSPITFDMNIVDVDCGGGATGEIQVSNIAGGTGPYDIEVVGGGSTITSSGVTSGDTITGLLPTYYSLTITDANGCEVEYDNPNLTGNVIAVQSPEAINYLIDVTDPACYNEDAMVEIYSIDGGNGSPYKYSFDGGSTWVDTVTATWIAPYADMDIAVANLDSTCIVSQTITSASVDNPDTLTAYIDYGADLAPTCIDGNDGNIHLIIDGGTLPYYYSINGSSWKETLDMLTIVKANVGVHEIMVKDANDCEVTPVLDTISLDSNIIVAYPDAPIECNGDKSGTIGVAFSSWADGLDLNSEPNRNVQFYVENEAGVVSAFVPSNLTGVAPEDITTFNAGTYIVWVVDQYTCESNLDTVVITEPSMVTIQSVVENGASCYNTFEGTITIHAVGGNLKASLGVLEYAIVNNEAALDNIGPSLWLPFETYDALTTLSTVSFNVDGGTYWLAVRDSCDEETYGPVEVDGYEELLVDEDEIVPMDPLCYETSTGSITVPMDAVTGGAGEYLFTLLDDGMAEIEGYVDLPTGEFMDLPEGDYYVLVEDSMDCPSYTTEMISLFDPDELEFDTEYMHMSCEDSNDGLIMIDVDGGTGEYWYAINNMNTWVAFDEGSDEKTYIATEPGTFRVWVQDENGCIAGPDTVTIMEPDPLDAFVDVVDNVSCYGGSDGEIDVEGLGGWNDISTFSFRVNNGSWTAPVDSGVTVTFSGLPAGDHMLYIVDSTDYSGIDTLQTLDCMYSVPFTITEPDPIVYDVMITDVKCLDGADGTFTVEILSGGTPFVDLIGDNDGFLVTLTGDAYNEGPFYTGADNAYTFTGLAHSHYTVYIEDYNGCTLPASIGDSEGPYTTEESWEVTEPATELTLDPEWIKDATCYGSEDGQFEAIADGGTPPYKYYAGLSVEPDGHVLVPSAPAPDSEEWQDSEIFNVGAGTWVVWVMDENGCMVGGEYEEGVPVNKWRVQVEQPDSIDWEFHMVGGHKHYVEPACYGDWNGEIHLVNITGGTGHYKAMVTGTSADGQAVSIAYDSIYMNLSSIYVLGGVPASDAEGLTVMVMDSVDCTSFTDTIFIDQPEMLTVDLVTAEGSFTCAGAVEGLIEAVVEGGTPIVGPGEDYEYQLLKNDVVHTPWQNLGSAFLVEVGNTFIVQVRDANGCVAEDTMVIDPIAEVVIVEVEDRSCYADETPTAVIVATAEEGRMLEMRYQKVSGEDLDDLGPWSEWVTFNEEDGMNTHKMSEGLTYGDEDEADGHYNFQVRDEMGCESDVMFMTFVPVQTQIEVTAEVDGYMITATATAGAVDSELNHHYEYAVRLASDDTTALVWQSENEFMVDMYGETVVYARDYHKCVATDTVMVEMPVMTIADVQSMADSSAYVGEEVKIEGTVSAVTDGGFFVQDDNAAWSGILVVSDSTVAIGDGVTVVGTVDEVEHVTVITDATVTVGTATLTVAAIEVLPENVEDEMYESVLVVVVGVRANAAVDGIWTAYTEETIIVTVDTMMYIADPVEGDFYTVTGIVNGMDSMYYIEPRMESDVVNNTDTNDEIISNTIEFKVYPNPFNDRINIDNNDKLTRVIISNIAGQRVIDVEYPSHEIRTANLVSGVYLVRMFTEEGNTKTVTMIKR